MHDLAVSDDLGRRRIRLWLKLAASLVLTGGLLLGVGTIIWAFEDEDPPTRPTAGYAVSSVDVEKTNEVILGTADLTPTLTIRVPQDYPTIQAGIDAAPDGALVLVSPGIYTEQLSLSGKTIILASQFYTTGNDEIIDQTIIDGQNATVITVDSSVGPQTRIIGFTIKNGDDGISASASLHILNNHFSGNGDAIDYEEGGGICRDNLFIGNSDDAIDLDGPTDVVIEDNIIRNSGDDGIEVRLHGYSGPTLEIVIRNNTISHSGEDGIQLIDYPDLSDRVFLIERNLIGNSAQVGLGLMDNGISNEDYRAASIPERIYLFNNTFIDNPYAVTGGDNLIALNNLFVNAAAIALKEVDGDSVAAYNLFWNNGLDNQGSNVDDYNSLVADPLLDPVYHLEPASPAIDAGTASYVLAGGETVLDLSPDAYNGNASDLGAFERDLISPPPVSSTIEVRVSASSDDAEERASGSVSLTSSDLELVFDNSDQTVGMRFNNLTIPPGAIIGRAYVQFQVDATNDVTTSLLIQGEAVDNATTFVDSSGNISSRARTTAAVPWVPPPWTTEGVAGPDQQTPDITPIIQEIVNRPGWAQGNSLVIIVTGSGERTAEAYDGVPAAAPLLHVEFQTSSSNMPPWVEISTPADNATFIEGATITFNGFGSDVEDGDLTASLSWESNRDGVLGSGGVFTRSDLSLGTHVITATATDSEGVAAFDRVTITILNNETAILVGAGDIAGCGSQKDEETALLLDEISGTVFTLGDNVYPDGSAGQFSDCYDPTWGRHKARTYPSPGNHDYHTTGAAGYFNYFGPAAGEAGKGYYSYNVGAWHIIVLNSECGEVGGCESDSPQGQWLQADLAANPRACTLAYWHHPRFSSGKHGNSTRSQDFWQLLYDAGADIVLNGHDHTYERFAPQDPNANADPDRGIREFVVGTGGAGLYDIGTPEPNSVVQENNTYGVLKLTLYPTSYDWEFVPIAGQTFNDSGSASCVLFGSVNEPPVIDAGPDQVIIFPDSATLNGTVTDDGLPDPPGMVSVSWSQISGSGVVTFADPNAVDTNTTFSQIGVYGLRLTADDGELIASDEVTISAAASVEFVHLPAILVIDLKRALP